MVVQRSPLVNDGMKKPMNGEKSSAALDRQEDSLSVRRSGPAQKGSGVVDD